MKKYIILLLLLLTLPCQAATVYYKQGGTGDGSGSCATAKEVSATISDSDARLCAGADITTAITIGANNTKITFETGAKMSKTTWTTGSVITCLNKSGVVIDGGTDGIIEATDNGTGLGSQDDFVGIRAQTCDNIEIKNVTVQNLYQRTAHSDDSNQVGYGIVVWDSASALIHHNTVRDGKYGISYYPNGRDIAGSSIYNNTISRVATGIVAAIANVCSVTTDLLIYDNNITDLYYWDGCWGGAAFPGCAGATWNHADGIHLWGGDATHVFTAVKIYNNLIGGDFGSHATAWIYNEAFVTTLNVYNNVLFSTSNGPNNAFAETKTPNALTVNYFNNTIIGNTGGNGLAVTGASAATVTMKNNILKGLFTGVYIPNSSASYTINYNNYFSNSYPGDNGSFKTWEQWQAAGYDANSITDNPLLAVPGYNLLVGSPADGAGTATGQLSANDKAGTAWATPPAIGAYEFVGEVAGPWTLGVVKVGNATITSSPAGISCGATCTYKFADTTEVTLTAVPDAWYRAVVWSGDCAAGGTVTMSAGKTCIATMERYYAITLGSGGSMTIGSGGTLTLGE